MKLLSSDGAVLSADIFYNGPVRVPFFILRDKTNTYSSDSHKEKEHIIAEFCVDLIEKYNYHLSDIQIREMIPLLTKGEWIYPEVDIAVRSETGKLALLIEVFSQKEYEKKLDSHFKKLFQIAESLKHTSATPALYLICYTRFREKGVLREQITTVDFNRFGLFEAWIEAGRPTEAHIPREI